MYVCMNCTYVCMYVCMYVWMHACTPSIYVCIVCMYEFKE